MTFGEIQRQAKMEWQALESSDRPRITIGMASCSRAAGASAVLKAIKKTLEKNGIPAVITEVGCIGLCHAEPLIDIIKPGGPHIYYGYLTPDTAAQLIGDYLVKDDPRPDLALGSVGSQEIEGIPLLFELPIFRPQVRVILRNCGLIDPENISHYIARDGYSGLAKALKMSPQQVIDEVKSSGLRGRGGAGFPTGVKWQFCRDAPGSQKYMVCNADEGDPGAFMDRSIMEGDPHSVIEGMTIAAYAIGASEGYIYIRAEYPLAVKRVKLAIEQAKEKGFLGENILGSGFGFNINIKEGAGAFVCGEETALMASIEGRRGMPRPRPPFPAQSGLWSKPTNINNVKSLASVPVIITKGADWYAKIGNDKAKGTAVFALTGKVANSGLVEVPMGTSLYQTIFEVGGGIANGKRFKAVQTGGPSGGCLPASLLNLPVDYKSLTGAGSIMGSGGMVVMDEDTCMVDIARYFLSFTQSESCGKCVPCRLGTKQMLGILEGICSGKGKMEDIDLLLELARSVKAGSLCGLGQTAPNPVLTTLRYFRYEYEEHIKKHHCRAAVCKGLVEAPCSHICPAGIDVPRYVRFIGQGKPEAALAVIREKIPFPAVCGLVCFHPCEARCRRGQLDEAIAIRQLKRYAAEHGGKLWKKNLQIAPATGKRVAVIGSGPAGLTAAYYLAKLGHPVTVFEALPEPGGMMRVAIPDYRLPKDVLQAEIEDIEQLGVKIKTGSRVESIDRLFDDGYKAVFIAVGAQAGLPLGIEGEDSPRVMDCIKLLRDISLGKKVAIGSRVAVIGGGNVAIDGARTALRLGAKEVVIIYRRSRAEMPAYDEEIEAALEEGVKIEYLLAPTKVTSANNKVELETIRMELGDIDDSGRRRPQPVEGSQSTSRFDTVIAAIGQRPDIPGSFNLATGKGNVIQVNPDTLATEREGVFAGGDAVTGPASVIEAIAHGRQAAISIDKYLGGKGDIEEKLAPSEGELAPLEEAEEKRRPPMPTLPIKQRLNSFKPVELGYDRAAAVEEAGRCLRCDLEED